MRSRRIPVMVVALAFVLAAASIDAQGGGRRGGSSAGGTGSSGLFIVPTRLVLLTASLKLTPEQAKATKATLDAAYKGAAEARAQLATAHTAIGSAIQAKKDPADIEAAVKEYARRAAAMTELEMKALAQVLQPLPEDIRSANARIDGAIAIMHGAFLGKKWDEPAGAKIY